MIRIIILLLLSMPAALGLAADEVLIPAELIQQLFETQDANQTIPKRPFSLSELERLLTDPRFSEPAQTRKDLTRRYLAITYPAGTTNVLDVVRSGLAADVREALFTASPGSLRLAWPERLDDALEFFELLTPELRETLIAAPPGAMTHPFGKIEISELLEVGDQRFQRIVPFYRPNVAMRDARGHDYLLGTPSRDHLLARFLEGRKAEETECSATIERCDADRCRTSAVGSSYASLALPGSGSLARQVRR